MEDFCREEEIVDEEEGGVDQEQQELEKRHCWAIITQFTVDTLDQIYQMVQGSINTFS